MRRIVLLVTLCVLSIQGAFSQTPLAVIVDSDGYAHVRDLQDTNKILGSISSGEIIYCNIETRDNWVAISSYNSNKKEGCIHNSRLVMLETYLQIPFFKKWRNEVILKEGNIEIIVSTKQFTTKNRKIEYNGQITTINGSWIYGTYGNLPQEEYAAIKIKIKDSAIVLPAESYNDVFNPNIGRMQANYDEKNDILYLFCRNSFESGGYIICWVIEKERYKNRYIFQEF